VDLLCNRCSYCEKSFRQPANLNFHVSRYHSEYAPPEKTKKSKRARENETSSSKNSAQDGILTWNREDHHIKPPSAKKPYNSTKARVSNKEKLKQQEHVTVNLVEFVPNTEVVFYAYLCDSTLSSSYDEITKK
jgi:hypothetical protein